MDDILLLRALELVTLHEGRDKLTIAGRLFVGKEEVFQKYLPQAEVIYLHYNANNLEEYDNQLDMQQPILTILDRLTNKIQDANTLFNVQVGLFRL